jgi:hypothetical protein
VWGCQPTLKPGFFRCDTDRDCPSKWFCHADQRCYDTREQSGAGAGDGDGDGARDAGGDGDDTMSDAGPGGDGDHGSHDGGGDMGADAMVEIQCGEAGSCGAGAHASPTCEQGQCGIQCDAHWLSCADPASDCETFSETRSVCGDDCTHSCNADQHCTNGACRTLDLVRVITASNTGSNENPELTAESSVLDSTGSLTVVGTLNGSFDPGNGSDIHSGKDRAGFMVRYTDTGAVNTSRTFVSSDDNHGGSLLVTTVDSADNIYVAGLCQTGVKFGGTSTITASGADDACVGSFSASTASFRWQASFGGGNTARTGEPPSAMAVTKDSLFVFGSFSGGIVGTQQMDVAGSTLTNQGSADIYLVRIDIANGEIIGGTSYGAAGNQLVQTATVDPGTGEVVVVGRFDGDFTLGDFTLKTHGDSDVFVARFAPDGSVTQAAAYGGSGADLAHGVGVAADGTTWVFGSVDTTNRDVELGSDSTGTPGGGIDLFVARYTRGGTGVSSLIFGSTGDDGDPIPGKAAIDDLGNFYIASMFAGDLTVGDLPVKVHGAFDVLLASFDPTGGVRYATRIGSEDSLGLKQEYPHSLAVRRADGPLYVLPELVESVELTLKNGTKKTAQDYVILRYDQ